MKSWIDEQPNKYMKTDERLNNWKGDLMNRGIFSMKYEVWIEKRKNE